MAPENNPHSPGSLEQHLTKAEIAQLVNEVLSETSSARRRDFSIALLAALLGGGISVLLNKAIGLLSVGSGYQSQVPESAAIILFILIIVGVLFLSGPRWAEVRGLAKENDRRLAELDARLDDLRQRTKR